MYNRPLSWLGTGTSTKSGGGVELVHGPKPPFDDSNDICSV